MAERKPKHLGTLDGGGVKIELTAGCVVGPGKDGAEGDTANVSKRLARQLIGMGKAKAVEEKGGKASDDAAG